MSIIKSIFSITAMITLAAPAIAAEPAAGAVGKQAEQKTAAEPADGAVAKQLEQKTDGYWAPDRAAMLKLLTEKHGMSKEDATAFLDQSAKLTIHVEKGKVHFYTTQGIVSTPYEMLGADKATNTLTLRAVNGPGVPAAQAVKIAIKEDQITVMEGTAPFVLKKIDENEFNQRRKVLPADRVGP